MKKNRTIRSFGKQHRTSKNPFHLVSVSFGVEREFSLFQNANHVQVEQEEQQRTTEERYVCVYITITIRENH